MVVSYSKIRVLSYAVFSVTFGIFVAWAVWQVEPGSRIALFGFEGEYSTVGSLMFKIIGSLSVLLFLSAILHAYRAFKVNWVYYRIDEEGVWSNHLVWKKTIPWNAISSYEVINSFGSTYIKLNLKNSNNDRYIRKTLGFSNPTTIDGKSVEKKLTEITKELDKYIKRA